MAIFRESKKVFLRLSRSEVDTVLTALAMASERRTFEETGLITMARLGAKLLDSSGKDGLVAELEKEECVMIFAAVETASNVFQGQRERERAESFDLVGDYIFDATDRVFGWTEAARDLSPARRDSLFGMPVKTSREAKKAIRTREGELCGKDGRLATVHSIEKARAQRCGRK